MRHPPLQQQHSHHHWPMLKAPVFLLELVRLPEPARFPAPRGTRFSVLRMLQLRPRRRSAGLRTRGRYWAACWQIRLRRDAVATTVATPGALAAPAAPAGASTLRRRLCRPPQQLRQLLLSLRPLLRRSRISRRCSVARPRRMAGYLLLRHSVRGRRSHTRRLARGPCPARELQCLGLLGPLCTRLQLPRRRVWTIAACLWLLCLRTIATSIDPLHGRRQ